MKKLLLLTFMAYSFSVFAALNLDKEYQALKKATNEKIELIEKKLSKHDQNISELSGEAKSEMKEKYSALVEMKDSLKVKLADAGDATADTWERTKDRVEDYVDDLESRIDKAIN